MKLRYLVAAALLPVMAACSKAPQTAPPAPAPAAAPAAEASPAPAPAAEAPAAPAAPEAAPAAPEPAAKPAAETAAAPPPPAASSSSAAAKTNPATPAGLKAGDDYKLISDGKPLEPVNGKIEVAEVFNYACPACNSFNPALDAWKQKLAADVHLIYIPADFRPDFVQYARAFYAADSLGLVEKTHAAVYEAIHLTHTLPGEGSAPDEGRIAAFYGKYGAKPEEFKQLMSSFAVNIRLAKGRQFAMHSQVTSTPSLIVNGKYLVKGKTWEDLLRVADQLIAHERAG